MMDSQPDLDVQVLLDHEPVADGGWIVRALLRLQGDAPADEHRTPLNLSLVLDRSGSMAGEKLLAAKHAAQLLVRRLAPSDTVSVVAFGSDVSTIAPPSSGADAHGVSDAIDSIDIEGMTNLSGGWLKARDHVAAGLREGSVNRIILMTDGQANEGFTDEATLCGLCSTAASTGLGTTTIGFGAGFNETLLGAMADAGGGNTYYIERPEQAPAVFADEIEGLLTLSAQNASVRIEPAHGTHTVAVLHSYPSSQDGTATIVEVGDVYAREPRLVMMQFLIDAPADAADAPVAVAHITVTAHVRTAAGAIELRTTRLPITISVADGPCVQPEVRREALLLEAARVRREALDDRDRGDFHAASGKLNDLALRMRSHDLMDPMMNEEIADLALLADRFSGHHVNDLDVKYMKQRAHNSMRSRKSSSQRISRSQPDVSDAPDA